ncbi:uncharacterized protein LODBEIA_P55490 [Lodderomyces beijingensis]|uniref:FAD-binding FR-type domain-containing protein n=1 Tax=Lodderomyces beijingensis TaxID=1775926 RepID=A0ABP0ZWM3_9ASCO
MSILVRSTRSLRPLAGRNSRLTRSSFVNFGHSLRLNSTKNNSHDQDDEKSTRDIAKRDDDEEAKNNLQEFKLKSTTSKSAPAPMEWNGMEKLMKSDMKPYIPKLQHQRATFEYPDLSNEDPYLKQMNKPKTVSRWSRYLPHMLTVVVVVWGAYTVKVWYFDSNKEEGEDSNDLLDPLVFHKFIIEHKEQIDDDHYLIEVVPKNSRWEYSFTASPGQKSLWDGSRIWSVEIKQPQINVVRSYTPLPLYFMKSEYTRSGEKKPLLKVFNPETDDIAKNGTMCFYIKRYANGEVSRYITDKSVGDELELRGPEIEYKFPYHPLNKVHQRPIFKDLPSKVSPDNGIDSLIHDQGYPKLDNIDFYAAGTGIVPILQVLFSKNPYLGHVNIHYFAQKQGELGANLTRFLLFLDKLDRIDMQMHFDNVKSTHFQVENVPVPKTPNFYTPKRVDEQAQASHLSEADALKLRMQVIEEEIPKPETVKKIIKSAEERGERYATALEQASVTSKEQKQPAALAIVCGPEGFVEYMAGPKDLVNRAQGQVTGVLGSKRWDNSNVYKL